MTTEYIHRVVLAVPEHLMEKSNHLACIVGEFSADINTFREANWQDADGNLYAVASPVVKPIFLQAAQGLPETPPHADGIADRALAQQALDTLNQPGGIKMIVDVDPMEALASLGLTPVVPEEEV
jgi:hypothetical protein